MLKSLEDEKTKSKYSELISKNSSARSSVPSILKNGSQANQAV